MILYIFKLFLTKNFKIIYYTLFKYCKSDKLQIHDLQEQTKRGIHSYGLRSTTSTMFLPQTNIFFYSFNYNKQKILLTKYKNQKFKY